MYIISCVLLKELSKDISLTCSLFFLLRGSLGGQQMEGQIWYIYYKRLFNIMEKVLFITVGSKIIRALEIAHPFFLRFDCQFLSSHACYKQYKA